MRGRVLGREFKLDVVRQLASGARKPAQACREYGVTESLLLRWRKEYEERAEEVFSSKQPPEIVAFEAKIAEHEPWRACDDRGGHAAIDAVRREHLDIPVSSLWYYDRSDEAEVAERAAEVGGRSGRSQW